MVPVTTRSVTRSKRPIPPFRQSSESPRAVAVIRRQCRCRIAARSPPPSARPTASTWSSDREAEPDLAGCVAVLRVGAGDARRRDADVGRPPRHGECRARPPPSARATSGCTGAVRGQQVGIHAQQAWLELGGVRHDSPAHDDRGARCRISSATSSPPVSDSATAIVEPAPRELSDELARRGTSVGRCTPSSARSATTPARGTRRRSRASGRRRRHQHEVDHVEPLAEEPRTAPAGDADRDRLHPGLDLAEHDAGMTWSRSATRRSTVMPTSRTRMTMVTHHGSSPRIDSDDERAADEHLVGDRVEQLAEVGDEVAVGGRGSRRPRR